MKGCAGGLQGVLFYLSRVVRQGGKLEEHVAVIHRALRALHRPQRKRSFAWVKERAASEPPERPASERNPIRAANVLVMSYYESIRRMQNDLVDAIKRHCATINRDQVGLAIHYAVSHHACEQEPQYIERTVTWHYHNV